LEQGFRIESREIVMEMNEFENPPLGLFLSTEKARSTAASTEACADRPVENGIARSSASGLTLVRLPSV
jgi:hypothetical protein